MKTQRIVAVLLTMALLMATMAIAPTGANPPGLSALAEGTGPVGHYRLASITWPVRGSASGGGYWLVPLSQPALTGSGCCCTYLPCVMR